MKTNIHIHPSVIIWLSILYYLTPEVVFPFLIAAACHEAAHYICLIKMRRKPCALTFTFSGAVMETPPMGYQQTLHAAAAGPAVSILLGSLLPIFPCFGLYTLILGSMNLIPVPGLDGYKALHSLLHIKYDPHVAQKHLTVTAACTASVLFLVSLLLSIYSDLGAWPMILSGVFVLRSMNMAVHS